MSDKPDITVRLEWDKRYVAGHVRVTLSDAKNEIERLRAALRWCSASADFAPDGQFRKDWEKIVAPLVNLYN